MAYVIYNLKTKNLLVPCRQASKSSYDSITAAKAAITRVAKAADRCKIVTRLANFVAADWAVIDRDTYNNDLAPVPKMITVKSLMSGKDIQIAEGTPRCCDPSSELYWTM